MKWLALVTAATLSLTACGDKNKQASDEPVKAATAILQKPLKMLTNLLKKQNLRQNLWFLQAISWRMQPLCKLLKMR